jgi:hypothetical protein
MGSLKGHGGCSKYQPLFTFCVNARCFGRLSDVKNLAVHEVNSSYPSHHDRHTAQGRKGMRVEKIDQLCKRTLSRDHLPHSLLSISFFRALYDMHAIPFVVVLFVSFTSCSCCLLGLDRRYDHVQDLHGGTIIRQG